MTIQVQADRSLVREAGKSVRFALVTFTAPAAARTASRPPLNVSFVLDRSGSMGGSKIELARTAIEQALRMLRDDDRFSVIAYDNEIVTVVPSTYASAEAVRNATQQVRGIAARGNTNLSGGWLSGCEQIALHLREGDTTRCILISDGLANEGIMDRDQLARHSAELRERGITTSCLGVGADYDERLLAAIATASRGHSYHIETPIQIPDILTSELGEALETVARDVTVTARAGRTDVEITTLNAYTLNHNGDGSAVVQLGDLVSRQDTAVVFRLKFGAGQAGEVVPVQFRVGDSAAVLQQAGAQCVFAFANHEQNDRQPRNRAVDRAVAELYAASARAEGLELNRAGRYDEARQRLMTTARKIEAYAGSDPDLRRIFEGLAEEHVVYSAPIAAMQMKAAFAGSLNMLRMRTTEGKARRRPSNE